jgi:transposase
MGQGRRQFTDEFKREAAALLASSGRPLTQIAAELGIAPSMLRNWRGRDGGRNAGPALRPNTPASAPHFVPDPAAEISRLRRENDRLRMERDILKKTVAIFSVSVLGRGGNSAVSVRRAECPRTWSPTRA